MNTAVSATTDPPIAGLTVLLQENFETDGHPDRYTASSQGGFRGGANGYFHRTDGSNIAIFSGSYARFSDAYFWAAEDTDNFAGNDKREQVLVFSDIDIAGFTNLSFSGFFGAGNTGFNLSYEAEDYIQVTAQIDGETETKILCFAYEDHGNGNNAPMGLDEDCNGTSDENRVNRLGRALIEYQADIGGTGDLLTLRIKARVDDNGEETAFDDIKVTGMPAMEPEPQPSNHPANFTGVASGSDRINLNWTDATGLSLPVGYVIYAGTNSTLPAPIDGTVPVPDTDLSNGDALVTVKHGAGAGYTFTGLRASTTYYFQIWAYGNTGSTIDYLTAPEGPVASVTTSGSNVLFHEGFETDGHSTGRYMASFQTGAFRAGHNAHFRRTNGSDIHNNSGKYAGFSGKRFWAAEDIDNPAGDGNQEQTIVFKPIDITGYTNLSVSGLFWCGQYQFLSLF